MSSVPSVKMVELNHYWIKAGAIPRDWQPQFYHCGAYNQTMDSFPVLRSHHHIIYIPASSKPLCRFLQHAMYALWYLSLCKRFNEQTRANFHRGSAYLHHLREAFFHEVREKFYASTDDAKSTDGDQPMDDDQPIDDYLSMYDDHIDEEDPQEMPACNKMTRQWFSSILFSWAQAIYHTHKLSPPDSTWLPPNPEIDQTSPTVFDWVSWLKSPEVDPVMKSLYGRFPNKARACVDWSNMVREANLSGNGRAPIVETDERSWRRSLRIALKLLEDNIQKAEAEASMKAGAQAMTETVTPTPMEVDTQPSVPHPPSVQPPLRLQVCKSLRKQRFPSPLSTTQSLSIPPINPQTEEKLKGKDKGKGKEKPVKSAVPSIPGSQGQVSLPVASGSGPGPSSSMMMDNTPALHEVTTFPKTLWEDVLTPQTMDDWPIGERTSEISRSEQMGERSWSDFRDRAPARPW
ncbi:hypothetical protein BD769DRAFT_1683595 [Suillus cothurnatus]|nr:hypothetical protein BD769DRAFT_1683595 [Suillus cothurnatus]